MKDCNLIDNKYVGFMNSSASLIVMISVACFFPGCVPAVPPSPNLRVVPERIEVETVASGWGKFTVVTIHQADRPKIEFRCSLGSKEYFQLCNLVVDKECGIWYSGDSPVTVYKVEVLE